MLQIAKSLQSAALYEFNSARLVIHLEVFQFYKYIM